MTKDQPAYSSTRRVCRRLACKLGLPLLCSLTGMAVPASNSQAAGTRELTLQEAGRLHLISGHGTTLYEQGRATGTYDCSITVHLAVISANRATATFTVSPRGGTISGSGSARYAAEGGNGYFGGTIAITRGSGRYARVSGREIEISGKINRETLNLTVRVHGAIRI